MKTVLVKKAGTSDQTPVLVATQAQLDGLIAANGYENLVIPEEGELDTGESDPEQRAMAQHAEPIEVAQEVDPDLLHRDRNGTQDEQDQIDEAARVAEETRIKQTEQERERLAAEEAEQTRLAAEREKEENDRRIANGEGGAAGGN